VFTFLPLHAAGIYEAHDADCCADYVVSSYTPTLTALLRAQRGAPSLNKDKTKLVLVAAMKSHNVNLPTLWNVEEEMKHVDNAAEQVHIPVNRDCFEGAATVERAAASLESATFAHIACHGIQDPQDALSSGFYLSDGSLTVAKLMELDLKSAFFAFLSACETAKGDGKQPDQTVHLAAAMLFVGFRSVVATMW
jgi:CHAT domain-containing protein